MDILFICIIAMLIITMLVSLCLVLTYEQQPSGSWQQQENGKYRAANHPAVPRRKEVLRLENLVAVRGQRRVLDKIELGIYEGEKVAIIGPSGAGKSTLVSCIRGELIPTQGNVVFEGMKLQYNSTALSQHYINVPVVDQSASSLVPFHSVYKSIFKQLLVKGLTRDQASGVAYKSLQAMRIEHKANSLPEKLSGGEKQRAVGAKALSMGNTGKLLLLDEPTSNLDPPLARDIVKPLLTQTNPAVIIITHQIELVMNDVDRILLLQKGKLADITIIKEEHPQCFTKLLEKCEIDTYYPELLKEAARLQGQRNMEQECLENAGNFRNAYPKKNSGATYDSTLTSTSHVRKFK
ncbi:MAG: energy-coupling factor ABC transporter ATP-binding protein [Planctomycetaceae bacterium]|nr:energy-coupling factor ABC transporter ATP-binding protein [Planctomycetaceae bacterium]